MEWRHHVFVSFRGADTVSSFVDDLCYSLTQAGIYVFNDEDHPDNESFLRDGVLRAIKESRLSIVVFSQTYADSPRCLDELVKIMECREETGQMVVPVFFDVDPSEVRGHDVYHFEPETLKDEVSKERVVRWKKALTEVANLAGWILRDRDNQDSIAHIVRDVSDKLITASTSFGPILFGIGPQIKQVDNLLKLESTDVLSLGIWGVGGIGKTTIAKAVYERISETFETSSFITNVGKRFRRNRLAATELKLLPDIPSGSLEVHSKQQSPYQTKSNVWNKKTLLVLDGVDSVEQLEVLPTLFEGLGPGSRVIITTRDKRVLSRLDIEFELKGLEMHAALQLFSWHAFRQYQPVGEFRALSNVFVQIAAGSPLVLEILGSKLYQRSLPEWLEAFSELQRSPFAELKKLSSINFDKVPANVGEGGREIAGETENGYEDDRDNDASDGVQDTEEDENQTHVHLRTFLAENGDEDDTDDGFDGVQHENQIVNLQTLFSENGNEDDSDNDGSDGVDLVNIRTFFAENDSEDTSDDDGSDGAEVTDEDENETVNIPTLFTENGSKDASDIHGFDGVKVGNQMRTIPAGSLNQDVIIEVKEHLSSLDNDSASAAHAAKKHELPFLIATAIVEAASACFEQLKYAKLALVMASLGLFLCLGELTYGALKEQARFRCKGFLPWLYSGHPEDRLFGTVNQYFGLCVAIWQTLCAATGYSYACKNLANPIQMNITMFIFSLFLITDKLIK